MNNVKQLVKVCVIGAPTHLGETFDYVLPESVQINAKAVIGHLVSVRFGNRTLLGIIIEQIDESNYKGNIKPISRIVSKIPLLTPQLIELYRKIAKYYASNLAQLLAFVIPTRHARAEESHIEYRKTRDEVFRESANLTHLKLKSLTNIFNGYNLVNAQAASQITEDIAELVDGNYALTILPKWMGWCNMLLELSIAQYARGQSVLLVLPSDNHLQLVVTELAKRLQVHEYAILSGSQDQETRYSNYLRVHDGEATFVVGTRASSLAPFEPDCVIMFGDQNGLFKENRAPYFNAREVCLLRTPKLLLFANYVPSFQVLRLVKMGYLKLIAPTNQLLIEHRKKVAVVASEYGEKIPSLAFLAIRKVLEANLPVLVSYPRKGYELLLSCQNCQEIANCTNCQAALLKRNVLSATHSYELQCVKCNTEYANWKCPKCNCGQLVNLRIGAEKLVEHLAKSFQGVVVRPSSLTATSGIIKQIQSKAQIIVATPNAEPYVEGGYGLVLIADAHLWGVLQSFDGTVDVLNQWYALVAQLSNQQAVAQSQVLLIGDADYAYRDALQRMNPHLVVERQLKDRRQGNLPPYTRVLTLLGTYDALQLAIEHFPSPTFAVLGPFLASETVYHRYFPNWMKQTESSGEPLQCYIVKTLMRNSEELSATTWRIQTILASNKLKSKVKLILDPKEFLS